MNSTPIKTNTLAQIALTTNPNNGILWLFLLQKALISLELQTNSIATYFAWTLDPTSDQPHKPIRFNIPTIKNEKDIVKFQKNLATIISLNKVYSNESLQVYNYLRALVTADAWMIFTLEEDNTEIQLPIPNGSPLSPVNQSNTKFSEYTESINIYDMFERLVKFAKGSNHLSAGVRLQEAMRQLNNYIAIPTNTSDNLQSNFEQMQALIGALYNSLDEYNNDNNKSRATDNPVVCHMMVEKMVLPAGYKEIYNARAHKANNSTFDPHPHNLRLLLQDIDKFKTEHPIKEPNGRASAGIKTDLEEEENLDIGDAKRKSSKERKANAKKAKQIPTAPTGTKLSDGEKSDHSKRPPITEAIKKAIARVREIKKIKTNWNGEDESKWINADDKTGLVCTNCKGNRHEFTHATEVCFSKKGSRAPTGRSETPYTMDNCFDGAEWNKGGSTLNE
jgi:hypothetical protein